LAALLLLALAAFGPHAALAADNLKVAAEPKVAASIKPLHSLVAGVMQGVGSPVLIVHGAGSPHTYAMRPSEARELAAAELVFWIGPTYEAFLGKPIAASRARSVALLNAPGVALLRARQGGTWEQKESALAVHLATDDEADPHVYLDPANAQAMVRAIAATLSDADPAHAAAYRKNADTLQAKLTTLDAEMAAQLAPVREVPYVVFHDGYQYLEQRYALSAVGSVVVSPERPPGAKRLAEIRDKIQALNAACVFAEPQFESALVRTVADGTNARTGVLDELGANVPAGPAAYFQIMRGLARDLVSCLKG
jgi:zinc transport system substrate-binding protein